MRCPVCGAKTERYAHVCGKCGAALPETPQPDYGPGVVGASDAETRWFVGPVLAIIIIVIAIAMAVGMVVMYYHDTGKASPASTSSAAYCLTSPLSRQP